MGTNENNEKVFFAAYFQQVILWKTGGGSKKGQNVCKNCTLSVGMLFGQCPRETTGLPIRSPLVATGYELNVS